MAEVAHIFAVQLSSVIAFVASIVAFTLILVSLRKFSPSIVKVMIVYIFIQTIMLLLSMGFMVSYHVFDIGFTQDAWHVGAMVSLLIGVAVTVQTVKVCRAFYLK